MTELLIQRVLKRIARKYPGAPLRQIIRETERELLIGLNPTWCAMALAKEGFQVADLPDQEVTDGSITDDQPGGTLPPG